MLHCNAVMKVTNEVKGIFSFYSHNVKKNFSESHQSMTVDLMFRLKVLIINESKSKHKYQLLLTLHCKVFHLI